MKKLSKYLDKNNICYQGVTFGTSYFPNVEPLRFDGCQITFDYTDSRHAAIYEKVKRYCKRYNYIVVGSFGDTWGYTIRIMTASDKAELDHEKHFETRCRESCERTIHIVYEMGGTPEEANELCKGIMEFWEEEYTADLRAKTA